MANIKSAQKHIRKTQKRNAQNRSARSRLRTLAKNVASAETAEVKAQAARVYMAALDKAAKTGIIHKNNASRHKAKIASFISAVAPAA